MPTWDGGPSTSFQTVEGYVPTVITACTPAGKGTLLESVNRLTGKRKAKYSPDGAATVFCLPEQDVDEVLSVEGTDAAYTLDSAKGTLTFYMRTGDRKHVRNSKELQLRQGQSPILTSIGQVKEFIRSALSGNVRDTMKAYGRVGSRMAGDIQAASGIDVSGYYLELDANRIHHLSDHITEDGDPRNIPLTQEQAENLTDYIDSYDDVLDTAKRKDGSVRITLGKRINGHAVIVELISRGRKSIQPVTAWQNTTEHYIKKYGIEKAQPIDASQLQEGAKRGYKPAVEDAAMAASIGTVPQSVLEVKSDPLMQILFGDGKPAEPEVKTDALMQAILDTIKPAQALPAPDTAGQELLRLYEEAQALPPEAGGDALIQALSGDGTTAPETAAESNAFIQGFQDDGDGPGTPGRDLRQADGLGDTPGLNAESDIADGIRRDIKSLWLGEEVIAFKDLPKEYKRQFRAALQQAPPEIKTLLRRYYPKADYIVQAGRHSYYDSGLAENVIALGTNAVPSTLAHELFHKIDRWNQISRTLKESLARDKATLETASGGQIKEYLMRRYPEAFVFNPLKQRAILLEKYRGIADILNGFSNGTIDYGYGHRETYWNDPGALETEAWAQFGRIQFQNDPDVMKMMRELFPNFFEHAMIKLKELI